MRLIELSANKESFRTVKFNPSGLSLIVGKKNNPDDKDRNHSTNGVGKSLLLYLIDFCLGSKENPEMEQKLPGWEFSLVYEIDGEEKEAIRSTSDQKHVVVNGVSITLKNYTDDLLSQVFNISEPVKWLTFRSLIGLFLRQGKGAYLSYDKVNHPEDSRTQLLRATYLLGLDIFLVTRKRELREEQTKIKELRKNFSSQGILREFMEGDRDVRLELKDLEEKINKLTKQISEFKVAENYDEVRRRAQRVKKESKLANGELYRLSQVLLNIERSLKEQPDLDGNFVVETFKSFGAELPEVVSKRVEEVSAFHEKLVRTRIERLTLEKHDVERRISSLESEIDGLNQRKDEYFSFLGTHGELAEYETLVNSLNDLNRQAEKLNEFKKLNLETKKRLQKCELELQQENIRANEYLQSVDEHTSRVLDWFREMARRIYPSHPSGLVIENNEGTNLQRFDIEAKIEADASDGIGEAKIFCFDMTVLSLQQNHQIKFLAHDNRLYPGIDPRQRAELFRIAAEYGKKMNIQYIATINEVDLQAMSGVLEKDEYESLFNPSAIVAELTDEDDKGKLLGIGLDLNYSGSKNTNAE